MNRKTSQSSQSLEDIQKKLLNDALSPDDPNSPIEEQISDTNEGIEDMREIQDSAEQAEQMAIDRADYLNRAASSKKTYFNLYKHAQQPQQPQQFQQPEMDVDPFAGSDESFNNDLLDDTDNLDTNVDPSMPDKFADAVEVRDYLDRSDDVNGTINYFLGLVDDNRIEDEVGGTYNPKQVLSDSLKKFFEGREFLSPQEKLDIAAEIYEVLPPSMKEFDNYNDSEYTEIPAIERRVADSHNLIKKQALLSARKKINASKDNRVQKTAQHKGMENVFIHGPNGARVDAITGEWISDWHVYERNKNWGFRLDDALNFDYEAFWRGNIMDKYSRPYRDKDGRYIGGYLNKRFEVDDHVPPENSYQLLPDQKRRPYVASHGLMEARLQDMRSQEDKRGREFENTDKPYDWNKALENNAPIVFNFKKAQVNKQNRKYASDASDNPNSVKKKTTLR